MRRSHPEMSLEFFTQATSFSKKIFNDYASKGAKIPSSPATKNAEIKCKGCLIRPPRLALQAFTYQRCMCCLKDELYSSSATDVLCEQCATENRLCKQCGADIDLNERRTVWPSQYRE